MQSQRHPACTYGEEHTSTCDPCTCAEIRRARLQFKKGTLSAEKYEKEINEYISYSIREQEKLGVDVLVHGEPERTDM